MKIKGNVIVNHKLVQVIEDPAGPYRVLISMERGGQVETSALPRKSDGLGRRDATRNRSHGR